MTAQVLDTFALAYTVTLAAAAAFAVAAAAYYSLRSARARETPVYLSGEPEGVVGSVSPSVGALYWGFMRRFARELYEALTEWVHTGSLHDWYHFLSSWLSFLLLAAAAAGILALLFG